MWGGARWTQSFLSDRRACVVYQNQESCSFRVRRGVLQGSVLGLSLYQWSSSFSTFFRQLLFLRWRSGHLVLLPLGPHGSGGHTRSYVSIGVLAEHWCLPLNPRKCEASFFSVDPHQANLQPNLLLLGSRFRFNPSPTFLGVTFDRTLSFSKHAFSLKVKFFPRLKALHCISASSWGPFKESLSVLYKAFLWPLLTYASPGWFTFLSVTNITKLERLHQVASHAITGCLSFSPIPLLFFEASLLPLRVTLTHFTLSSYERALCLPTSFPISGLARLGVRPRLCRSSWELLLPLIRSCFLLHFLGKLFLLALSFLLGICLLSLWSPPLSSSCTCTNPSLSRQGVALAHLYPFPPHDLILWTYGSVPSPFGKSGSGVLANCFLCGTEATLCFWAGSVCSSFSAEACAILHALCWSWQHQQICHFSSLLLLSMLATLSSPPFFLLSQTLWQIWQELSSLSCSIRLQWVPGHWFLPGNDVADELARWGALLAPSTIPCSLSPLISRIHSCLFSNWRRTVSSKFFDTQVPSISTKELVLPRHARCALSRLRCNRYSLLLSSCLPRIGRIENPSCSACGHSPQDTSDLILHCPGLDSLRCSLFGDSLSLYDLWSRPWGVARLLGLHVFPPRPIPWKGLGKQQQQQHEKRPCVTSKHSFGV